MKIRTTSILANSIGTSCLVFLLVACGGGGGSGSGTVTPNTVIRADNSTLRTISSGEIVTYNLTQTDESYDWDGTTVIESSTGSSTVDINYSSSNLALADGTRLTAQVAAYGDGTLGTAQILQLSNGTILDYQDDEGFDYFDIDNQQYGIPFLISPLVSSTTTTINYNKVSGGNAVRVGVRVLSIGGIELVDTPLGGIEAYKVTSRDTEEDTFIPVTTDVSTTTYWVNPEIGIVKILEIDESYLFGSTRATKSETLATFTSVNFVIPAAE